MGKYLISKVPTYILKIRFRHKRKGKVRDDPQIMMCEHSHNMKKTENKESRNCGNVKILYFESNIYRNNYLIKTLQYFLCLRIEITNNHYMKATGRLA